MRVLSDTSMRKKGGGRSVLEGPQGSGGEARVPRCQPNFPGIGSCDDFMEGNLQGQ